MHLRGGRVADIQEGQVLPVRTAGSLLGEAARRFPRDNDRLQETAARRAAGRDVHWQPEGAAARPVQRDIELKGVWLAQQLAEPEEAPVDMHQDSTESRRGRFVRARDELWPENRHAIPAAAKQKAILVQGQPRRPDNPVQENSPGVRGSRAWRSAQVHLPEASLTATAAKDLLHSAVVLLATAENCKVQQELPTRQ